MTGNKNIYVVWYGTVPQSSKDAKDVVVHFLQGSTHAAIPAQYEDLHGGVADSGHTYKVAVTYSNPATNITPCDYSLFDGALTDEIGSGVLPIDRNGLHLVVIGNTVQNV